MFMEFRQKITDKSIGQDKKRIIMILKDLKKRLVRLATP